MARRVQPGNLNLPKTIGIESRPTEASRMLVAPIRWQFLLVALSAWIPVSAQTPNHDQAAEIATPCDRPDITLAFPAGASVSVEVLNETTGLATPAFRNGTKFVAFNIPLAKGVNVIRAVRTPAPPPSSLAARHVVRVRRAAEVRDPIRVLPEQRIGSALPFQTQLLLSGESSPDAPTELWIDLEADGVIDSVVPYATAYLATYTAVGRYKPRVTIRTSSGLLYSSHVELTLPVSIVAAPVFQPSAAFSVPAGAVDIDYDESQRRLYVLTSAPAEIAVLSLDQGLLQTIPLPNAQSPQGFGRDADGNIYVADTGNNAVLKLLASSNFQPDMAVSPTGTFGSVGSGDGEFTDPVDVAVVREVGQDRVFVADRGNHRIQRFTALGVFKGAFDGATEPGGALVAPQKLLGDSGVVVVDSATNLIRSFDFAGGQDFMFGGSGPGAGSLASATDLALSAATTGFAVLDATASQIKLYPGIEGVGPWCVVDAVPGGCIAMFAENDGGTSRVWLLPAAGGAPLVAALNIDPPGAGPLDCASAFVAALAAQDLAAASTYCDEGVSKRLVAIWSNVTYRTQVVQEAQAVFGLGLTRSNVDSAYARGSIPGVSYWADFPMGRDSFTGAWVVESMPWSAP